MDSPAFRRIYDLAAENDLPVLVHHNLSPKHCGEPMYVHELIRALEYNRDCRIIWAHVGMSREIEKYSDRVLLGTDKVGHWADYPGQVGKYYPLLDQLSPETAEKVCRGNALSLIKRWDR